MDRLLCAFAVMILGLIGIVYGAVCSDMDQFDSIQRSNVERIARVEQHQRDISDKLLRIEDGQEETQKLLNRILIGLKLEK